MNSVIRCGEGGVAVFFWLAGDCYERNRGGAESAEDETQRRNEANHGEHYKAPEALGTELTQRVNDAESRETKRRIIEENFEEGW